MSVICVFNDQEVLRTCLQRSILGSSERGATELIAVDNTGGRFSTPGAALNFGAKQASNPCLVFAHQDVYIHSVAALERAATQVIEDPTIGIAGAIGPTALGPNAGMIRDRFIVIGRRARTPSDVDSLDEVLFLIGRERYEERPLIDDARLGWHGYAVEYGMAAMRDGLRVVAVDVPLTHNSLSTNLAGLEHAHATLATLYPELLPLRTTCGVIGGPPALTSKEPRNPLARELRGAAVSLRGRRAFGPGPVARLDLLTALDGMLEEAAVARLAVRNRVDDAADHATPIAELTRRSLALHLAPVLRVELGALTVPVNNEALLITNLTEDDLASLPPELVRAPHLLGSQVGDFGPATGYWLLISPNLAGLAARLARARGLRARVTRRMRNPGPH